jgi:hypothetical protein
MIWTGILRKQFCVRTGGGVTPPASHGLR